MTVKKRIFTAYLITTDEEFAQLHRVKMVRMVLRLCLLLYPLGRGDQIRLSWRFSSCLKCTDKPASNFMHVRPRPNQETGAMQVELAGAVRLHDVVYSKGTVNTKGQNALYRSCQSKLGWLAKESRFCWWLNCGDVMRLSVVFSTDKSAYGRQGQTVSEHTQSRS